MTIVEAQNEIIEEFELFDDLEDKYIYLIDLGAKLPPLPESFRTPERKIHGCASNVWLYASSENGLVIYQADSGAEAKIARGMISMLLRVLSGRAPQDIIQAEIFFFEKIGLGQHLTMQRVNGLASMIKQMKMYALALQNNEQAQ